jgi:twitching motility protein PilT
MGQEKEKPENHQEKTQNTEEKTHPEQKHEKKPDGKESHNQNSTSNGLTLKDQATELINKFLIGMVDHTASDLHLRAGMPAVYRIDGNLVAADKHRLSPELAKEALFLMINNRQQKVFELRHEVDFSFAVPHVGRFRGNAFRQRGSVAVVLRQIPTQIPGFDELKLPPVMKKFCQLSRGLVLICGPTGSGKSTSLAAMIDFINHERAEHIVTIEDPIEFLYKDKKSIVSQRELGTDTLSFGEALKHVLRQDPDVILLGEMRDLETTQTAITAAQTGHLVLSTLHTTDAVQTINRIVDLYPPHQQSQVRFQLADVLKGVVCQRLIPHASGKGRIPASEVLVVTALVRKAIADNQMQDVNDAIRQGQYYGMQSFHQALLKAYQTGEIKLEEALDAASNPEELMMAIRGITSGTEGAA